MEPCSSAEKLLVVSARERRCCRATSYEIRSIPGSYFRARARATRRCSGQMSAGFRNISCATERHNSRDSSRKSERSGWISETCAKYTQREK